MGMDAGLLDRRVTIQRRVESQNEFGEAEVTYVDEVIVWAEVVPLAGRELFVAEQVFPEAQLKINIRWRPDLTERHRILYDNQAWVILHLAEIGRRVGIKILVKKP
jgi:SPP1 family predicted phage head-tail adaptor